MKQNRNAFCALCIAVAAFTFGISAAYSQETGCLRVAFDSVRFGPVFYGASDTRTMSLTNEGEASRTINTIDFNTADSSEFSVFGNQLPVTILPHETAKIGVTFTPLAQHPDSSDNFRTTISVLSTDGSQNCSETVNIFGEGINPTDLNQINPFDRKSILPALKFSGTDEIFGQNFRFQCTDTAALKVLRITMVDQDSQLVLTPIGACSGLPMTAMPGDILAIRLTLQTYDSKVHYNQIRFTMGNGVAPIIFTIEAQRIMPQAAVRANPPSSELFAFSTVPNPSAGNIAIQVSGENHADIEIFDQLGKSLLSQKNITSWNWNGQSANGTPVPSGNYFIRAITSGPNGQPSVSTKQVAIIR
jgi:hypothetical protein